MTVFCHGEATTEKVALLNTGMIETDTETRRRGDAGIMLDP